MEARSKIISRMATIFCVSLFFFVSGCATGSPSSVQEPASPFSNESTLPSLGDQRFYETVVTDLCQPHTFVDIGPGEDLGVPKRGHCILDPLVFPASVSEHPNGQTVHILEVVPGGAFDAVLANEGSVLEYSVEAPLGDNYLQIIVGDSLDWLIVSERVLVLHPEAHVDEAAGPVYVSMSDEELIEYRCIADFVWAFELKEKYDDLWDLKIAEIWSHNQSDLSLLENLVSDFQLQPWYEGKDALHKETSWVQDYCSRRGGYPSESYDRRYLQSEDDELRSEMTESDSQRGSQIPPDDDDWSMSDLRASADPSDVAGPECEALMAETLRLWALGDGDREALLEPFTPEGQVIMGDLIDYVTVEGLSPLEAKRAMGNIMYPNICK